MRVGGLLAVAGVAQGLTLSEEKNRPVTKVITLLKDMQKQLQNEVEADQEIYDKMACWCTTNDKAKTKAIAEAGEKEKMLTAAIEEGVAKSAQLTTEIDNLTKEVAANTEALNKATELRRKALAEFNAEEKDLLQSIASLKSAITVLKKQNSLLQTDSAEMEGTVMPNIAVLVKHLTHKYADKLEGTIAPSQQRAITEFISQKNPAYAAQSGEIFGILESMMDNFNSDLKTQQSEEAENAKAYEDLKAAKEEEIKAGQDQIDKKEQELADTDEKVAEDKTDLEDTGSTLAADEAFLADLKEKCKMTDQEFAQRQKTRTEEIAAVGEALKYLSSDEAHDLFTNTFNFTQTTKTLEVRNRAAAVLLATKNPKLSTLATQVKLDAFTKVKAAMDQMVADLKKEAADEVKHRDYCVDSFAENAATTAEESRNKADANAKIDQLTQKIKNLTDEIDLNNEKINDSQVQMKRAGEDREKENAEFQQTVSDQRATQKLLTGASNALKGFYEKSKGNAFIQSKEPAGPPPPAGFKSYENNAAGGGVIAMITQIINDAKAMEAEAIHDEEDAQAAYESFVKETNNTIKACQKALENAQANRGTAEVEKVSAEQDLDNAETELEMAANNKLDLHKSCDFVMKNFDIRQDARQQEIEAIAQAKAILSGMK
jgi:chromosome segregation ATPase